MKKSKIIILVILIAIIIAGVCVIVISKPSRELDKAIDYLKYEKYKGAYEYIENTQNEENKIIIKELLSEIFCDKMSKGIQKQTNIANEAANVFTIVDRDNINESLDDNININVKGLDAYIELENKISKNMIIKELEETYDTYFETIKYVRNNFIDVLNRIDDDDFLNYLGTLSSNMIKVANDLQSVSDNYDFNPKTDKIMKDNNF